MRYFSAQTSEFQKADAFYRYFLDLIYKRAEKSEVYQRCLASVRFASPKVMMAWGRSSGHLRETGMYDFEFISLKCQKTTAGVWRAHQKRPRVLLLNKIYQIGNMQVPVTGRWLRHRVSAIPRWTDFPECVWTKSHSNKLRIVQDS